MARLEPRGRRIVWETTRCTNELIEGVRNPKGFRKHLAVKASQMGAAEIRERV